MQTKTKKLFGILLLIITGLFSWDFSANTAFLQSEGTQFSDEKCEDIPVAQCTQTSGCEVKTPFEDAVNRALGMYEKASKAYDQDPNEANLEKANKEQETYSDKIIEFEQAKQSNTDEFCEKRSFLDDKIGETERDDRRAANDAHCATYREGKNNENGIDGNFWNSIFYDGETKVTRATHGKTVFKGAESQLKTACKNDAQCKWSSSSKECKGKAGASTQEYLICSQAGLEKCDITIGCAKSTDGTQCLPEGDEEFSEDGEAHDEFGSYKGPIFGGPGLRAGARIAKQKLDNTISKERSLKKLIIYWTNFALSITALIAVIALVYAGILYITDMGDGSNSEKAKKIIMYVAIGIIVILGSYAIVNTVMKARFGNEESAISYNHNIEIMNNHLS